MITRSKLSVPCCVQEKCHLLVVLCSQTTFMEESHLVKRYLPLHTVTLYVGLSLCWKAVLKNTTPHQQHWAERVQESPGNHLFVIGPEPLLVLIITLLKIQRKVGSCSVKNSVNCKVRLGLSKAFQLTQLIGPHLTIIYPKQLTKPT